MWWQDRCQAGMAIKNRFMTAKPRMLTFGAVVDSTMYILKIKVKRLYNLHLLQQMEMII